VRDLVREWVRNWQRTTFVSHPFVRRSGRKGWGNGATPQGPEGPVHINWNERVVFAPLHADALEVQLSGVE
jgi:hypothetical protein